MLHVVSCSTGSNRAKDGQTGHRQEILALEARIKALENVVVSNGLQLHPPVTSNTAQPLPPNGHLTLSNPINIQQNRLNRKRPLSVGSQPESSYPTNKLARSEFEEDNVSDRFNTPSESNVTEVSCDALPSQLIPSNPWLLFQCNNEHGSLMAQFKPQIPVFRTG